MPPVLGLTKWKNSSAILGAVELIPYGEAGFSVEAGNRRIPPAVKTKVAACAGNEICLCVPIFFKIKSKYYSRTILEFSAYLEEPTNALSSLSNQPL